MNRFMKKKFALQVVVPMILSVTSCSQSMAFVFTIATLKRNARTCSSTVHRSLCMLTSFQSLANSRQMSIPLTTRYTSQSSIITQSETVMDDELRNKQQQLVQDILYRIRQVNSVPTNVRESLIEFRVDGIALGQVRPSIAKLLCSYNITTTQSSSTIEHRPAFIMNQVEEYDSKLFLTLSEHCGTTFESRSESIATITKQMNEQGYVTGWRDELFPVTTSFYSEPVFSMERAAVSFLGVPEYGVHIIGLVQQPLSTNVNDDCANNFGKPTLQMWMARRSPTKSKWPNMMDHIAAGGQPIGLSLIDNVVKECYEEACIPESITRNGLRPAGAVTYENYVPHKDVVERIVLFCFDLYLPSDFQPKPVDGEVEEFYLYTIEDQVLSMMSPQYHDPMKPNCYLVVIDFLIRHGYISPDIPGYLDIVRELRTGVCQ